MKAFPFSSLISVVLSPMLVMTPLWAQAQLPSSVMTGAEPDTLQIRVLNTDNLQSMAHTGAKQNLSVQVADSSGAAVSNAAVTCRLPDSGPTGIFGDGTHAAVAYTDNQGRATIDKIEWGAAAGPVAIRLTATKGTAHTGILVETNLVTAGIGTPALSDPAAAPVLPQLEQTVVAVPYVAKAEAQPATTQPVVAQPTVSVMRPAAKPTRQPGEIAKQAGAGDPGPDRLTPVAADPTVSVTHTAAADAPHSSHAKWYVLLGVAVAAGAGAAFAMKGKSSTSSSTNSSSLSIGNPSISVGHP